MQQVQNLAASCRDKIAIMKTVKSIFIIGTLLLWGNNSYSQNAEKSKVKINNLRLVNSKALDFSPAYFKEDLVFVSNNTISGKTKIFDKDIKQASMSLFITKK